MRSEVGEASKRERIERARLLSRTERLRAFAELCRQAAELAASGRRYRASQRR